ncbi:MAG: hypothetical protein GY716_01420 [bacterium]|nr:hypothetical protein [bacterium]
MNAVRAAVGSDIEVKCDANASYNREDALKALHGARDAGLQHFEQPLAQHDIEGAAYLAQRTSIPICGDESLQTLRDAFNILKRDAASAMVLKLMKNGGMYRSQQIVALCSAIGVPCYLSSGTDLSLGTSALLHCYASTPGFAGALETADLLADDVAKSPLVRGPSMQVPTGAGLGVELDEQKVEKYRKKLR